MTVVQLIKELSKYPAGMDVKTVVFYQDFPADRIFAVQDVIAARKIEVLKNEAPYVGLKTGHRT